MDILDGSFFSQEDLTQELQKLRYRCMGDAHPQINMPLFLSGEWGARFAAHKLLSARFSQDPMGEEVLNFYQKLGLKKEMFEVEDYYTRWTLITPIHMDAGRKYPLIIFAHGAFGSLEGSEFAGYAEFQAEEEFMALYPQNTNPDWIQHILSVIRCHYPLDEERIYMGGYSAGGAKTIEAFVKMRGTLAACAPCAGGIVHWSENITKEADNLDDPYSFLPIIRIESEFDPSLFVPLNRFVPRLTMLDYFGLPRPQGGPRPAGADIEKDPTFDMVPDGKGGMVSSRIKPGPKVPPPKGITYDQWKVAQMSYRLRSLGCRELDLERCMSFADTPQDRLHHLFGCYGDQEYSRELLGVPHHFMDYYNRDQILAFRFIVIQNALHNPTPMLPRLTWEFFKQFRRDAATGRIIQNKFKSY